MCVKRGRCWLAGTTRRTAEHSCADLVKLLEASALAAVLVVSWAGAAPAPTDAVTDDVDSVHGKPLNR